MRPIRLAKPMLVALCGTLYACSGTPSGFPSLAPRPVERLSLAEPSRPEPPAPVASAEGIARFAPLVDRARAADAAFQQVLAAERPALARGRGAADGSEAWTAAQVSLSRVETARGPVQQVLGELDAARSSPEAATDTGTSIAAAQAFDAVRQIDAGEQQALDTARLHAPQ